MGAKGFSLFLLTPDKKALFRIAAHGLSDGYIRMGPVLTDKSMSDSLTGKAVEVGILPKKTSLNWIGTKLCHRHYADPLKKAIAREVVCLAGGNPAAISRMLATAGSQAIRLDDPIRIRRMFVDGRILEET